MLAFYLLDSHQSNPLPSYNDNDYYYYYYYFIIIILLLFSVTITIIKQALGAREPYD